MKKLSLLAALSAVVLLAGCVNTNPTDEEIAEDVIGIEYVEEEVEEVEYVEEEIEEVEDVVELEEELEEEIVNE